MWQWPRWQHQLQVLLCASCPAPFSFKASRSASQSRAACKTSTSSAMQGQSIPQASRKPRSSSDGPTGNRPSRSSGIHRLRSRSRGLLHLRLVWGCQGLCLMRSLCWRPFFSFSFSFLGGKDIHYTIVTTATSRAYDVHCKPKGSSPHHNLNQWMKHTRESTAHIRACHRACQNGN